MILVTVGTHGQGFDRLVKAMDEVAVGIEERVVIQYGSSTYEPQHAESFRFTDGPHMEQLTKDARVVVSHAAAGSILVALRLNKPLIVVPRLSKFEEVIDDHQQQLAAALAAEEKAVVVQDPTAATMGEALREIGNLTLYSHGPEQLMRALRQQVESWNSQARPSRSSASERV